MLWAVVIWRSDGRRHVQRRARWKRQKSTMRQTRIPLGARLKVRHTSPTRRRRAQRVRRENHPASIGSNRSRQRMIAAGRIGPVMVVVAVRTTGDARIVAASREFDFMEIDAAPAEDVTTIKASAFRDQKSFHSHRNRPDGTDGVRGILEGDISVDTIRPVQPDCVSD